MADVAINDRQRLHVRVAGLVQGVGFRPFVFRTAGALGLAGFVENNDRGVDIEVEGERSSLEIFLAAIEGEAPPLAAVASLDVSVVQPRWDNGFHIRGSERRGLASTRISPDVAICPACLGELFDPDDRRYRYPFINCTNCGPRYTIVEGIPYDRPMTSMKGFALCPECHHEYHDPTDRRFHAQPNACPACGPQVELVDRTGRRLDTMDPFETAPEMLRAGLILAVKGLGGFHLVVDPHDHEAVQRLRARKGRAEKPFALMSPDIESISRYCIIKPEHEQALTHRSRPIVLLEALPEHGLARSVAPGMDELGFMLAYTPLHFLLLTGNFGALVMTSANLSEEPIAIGNDEALCRLADIADYFLVHDRDILQRCDDSVARVVDGAMVPIRRSRGFVPNPVEIPVRTPRTILACGGEMKNTVALAHGASVILSQHIGDLDNESAYRFFEHSIGHLQEILEITPKVVAFDMHPEYLSTKWARDQRHLWQIEVQHHHAHLAAVMAENRVTAPTIGVILDGTGYGTDGTIWGGEVLVGDLGGFDRFAWLRTFGLPGGEAAIRHPWRIAYTMINEAGEAVPSRIAEGILPFRAARERELLDTVIRRGINTPQTSSCGRLFDGVSAILGLCREVRYEAQAAIALEMAADREEASSYLTATDIGLDSGPLDWMPILVGVLADLESDTSVSVIAGRFHRSLGDLFTMAAIRAREETGIQRVGLSGGVFQNRLLFDDLRSKLRQADFEVITHRLVPTNDGGLAYGQAAVAAWQLSNP